MLIYGQKLLYCRLDFFKEKCKEMLEKEKVLNIVKDKMENVIKLSVPIIISSDYGTNWYDAK